jgi:hypothetical protein
MAITDKIDLAVSGGPSIIHVKQDLGSITVAPGTQNTTTSIETQSKTTAKAGNVGVDDDALWSGRLHPLCRRSGRSPVLAGDEGRRDPGRRRGPVSVLAQIRCCITGEYKVESLIAYRPTRSLDDILKPVIECFRKK